MQSGKLDRTIALQRIVETVSASGDIASTWTNFATVRAELIQASADETPRPFGEAETTSLKFRIRWIPNVEVTTADRVLYSGTGYDIKDVLEIGRRRGFELRCERTRL